MSTIISIRGGRGRIRSISGWKQAIHSNKNKRHVASLLCIIIICLLLATCFFFDKISYVGVLQQRNNDDLSYWNSIQQSQQQQQQSSSSSEHLDPDKHPQDPQEDSQPDPQEDPQPDPQPTCGILINYHVGKCGGSSIKIWQSKLSKLYPNQIKYYDYWQLNPDDGYDYNPTWSQTILQIEKDIYKLIQSNQEKGNNYSTNTIQWISIHQHHRTPGLFYSIPNIYSKWKRILLEKSNSNCKLILTTVLREPLSRTKSMLSYNQVPITNFYNYITTIKEWQTLYLMYNSCQPMKLLTLPSTTTTTTTTTDAISATETKDHHQEAVPPRQQQQLQQSKPPEWCTLPSNALVNHHTNNNDISELINDQILYNQLIPLLETILIILDKHLI